MQYWNAARALESAIPVTFLPAEVALSGTFKSVVWAFRATPAIRSCVILGIDAIVTQYAMAQFIASVHNGECITFMVSPMLAVAPTHGRIRLNSNGGIAAYRKSTPCPHRASDDGWYCDVGVRYFSADFVGECRLYSLSGACDFDDIMPSMVDEGRVFGSYVLNERWLHFAHSRDFLQKPL